MLDGMTQSMSRVARCIDNGPAENFCGILKHEKYYDKRFTFKQELIQMVETTFTITIPGGCSGIRVLLRRWGSIKGHLPRKIRQEQNILGSKNLILFSLSS